MPIYDRSSDRNPDCGPGRTRDHSPGRSRDHSPGRTRDHSPGRTRDHSPARPRRRSRSRSRSGSHGGRDLSPDYFGPKLPKPRNREREREEHEHRLHEARNIKRIRMGSPRRSRSRSRERHGQWMEQRGQWTEQRGGPNDYYDQQRDDAQRQRQEAFIARYRVKCTVAYEHNFLETFPCIFILIFCYLIAWFFFFFPRRLQERERIGELGSPEVWGYSPRVKEPEYVFNRYPFKYWCVVSKWPFNMWLSISRNPYSMFVVPPAPTNSHQLKMWKTAVQMTAQTVQRSISFPPFVPKFQI